MQSPASLAAGQWPCYTPGPLKTSDTFALAWFAAFSALAFLAFGFDKWRASQAVRRVPESFLVLLGGLGFLHMKAHVAAIASLVVAIVVAVFIFGMPAGMALKTAFFGGLFGLRGFAAVLSQVHSERTTVPFGKTNGFW